MRARAFARLEPERDATGDSASRNATLRSDVTKRGYMGIRDLRERTSEKRKDMHQKLASAMRLSLSVKTARPPRIERSIRLTICRAVLEDVGFGAPGRFSGLRVG
jgi:hypothetical protein